VAINVEWTVRKKILSSEIVFGNLRLVSFTNSLESWASSMQAQQVQQQAQHQQITGANVILKMSDIQQLSTVGMFDCIKWIGHIT
jgi:hypothetical protein